MSRLYALEQKGTLSELTTHLSSSREMEPYCRYRVGGPIILSYTLHVNNDYLFVYANLSVSDGSGSTVMVLRARLSSQGSQVQSPASLICQSRPCIPYVL